MGIGFTETLRLESEPLWSDAVGHRFVRELCAGTISDAAMSRYLIQDHRFIDAFVTLLGAAIAAADKFESRIRLGKFVGMVCGEENTYFLRAFDALGISESERTSPPDTASTTGFKAIMREAAATRSYAATLAVLSVAEGIYLDWALKAPKVHPDNFIHAEWITLHDNADFKSFVAFLHAELDRVGPHEEALARDFFLRTVRLERDFFDSVYAGEA